MATEELSDMRMIDELTQRSDTISHVERLLNDFEAHERKEETSLDEYRKLLVDIRNPITRFVLQLIISDEEKHRAVIHAMVSTLKGSLSWTKPPGTLEGGVDAPETNKRLQELTREFIELEKSGIREYKILLKEATDYYHGLFKILLNSMIRDSEKHVEFLEFLRQRLKEE